ncbi:50S ribosomal protein L22 [Candidatus Nanobsidianus stetteri]|jgi:large subunit ribosomal protein L22|uniref:50S ribosomal protein L22 n=1 Tax=Nanobsidianus stetteri TaxID=1294122 RepID=A0A2T9WLK0_NANST|nr:50S ribosomal protein L22 [Candidatus Nanobsidianus stetteri]MCC5447067.1 50S ribosomal protein L22 [Candidatus Nanobsidianus stetteri]
MDSKLVSLLRENKKIVTVSSINLPISRKDSEMVGRFIKYLTIPYAKKYLEMVIEKKIAVPYYRYHKKQAHHKNVMGKVPYGRYPVKVSKYFIKLLNSLENNAKNMGLDPNKVVIVSVNVSKGNKFPGRLRVVKIKTGPSGIRRALITVHKKTSHIKIYGLYLESLDTSKKLKRKGLKQIVKQILEEWRQKI